MRLSYLIFSAALLLASCSSTQKGIGTQDADLAYSQKNYVSALESYNRVIDSYTAKKQKAPASVLAAAGKCLYNLNDKQKAMDMFSQASDLGFTDEESLFMRISYYGELDNLSKEVDCLDKYVADYPQGANISAVNARLFSRYVEMAEYDKAFGIYSHLSESDKDNIPMLEKYYQTCKKLGKDSEALAAGQKIYGIDPNNVTGLGVVAYQAYITTENEYVAAIKAYEAKKTNEAYAKLQKTTTPLVARFKKARDLYLKLYGITKKPHDAQILSRIYTRLNDKKNADYYSKLAKQ